MIKNTCSKFIYSQPEKLVVFTALLLAFLITLIPLEIVFPIVISCAGLFICISLVILSPKENHSFFLSLLIGAFLSRVAISLFLYNFIYVCDGKGLPGDAWGYSESGYSMLQMWLNGIRDIDQIVYNMTKITTSGNLGSYDFWNAIVYYFTGKSPLSLIFINCLAGSLTAIFIYYTTKGLCNDDKAAKISAMLTAFWPSLFSWSIQNLKESLSGFLIAILIWGFVQLRIKFRFYPIFLIILSSIALKELRMVSFTVFYAAILPVSLILFLWKRNRILFIFLIACGSLITAILANNYVIKTYGYSPIAILKYMYQMRSYRAYGNTAFLANIDIFNPLILIAFAPIMVLVAWLSPFPWQIGSLSQISAVPEMIIYYLLLPAMFSGWGFIMRHKVNKGGIIIVYIFIMMLVLAFIEGNIGTLFRHRAMILPFMFVLIGIGHEKIKIKITAHD